MVSAPAGSVNLALGELGYDFPELLRAKAIELLQTANPCYTPNAGLACLREAIAAYESAEPTGVCVCNGAEEALYISLLALLNKGEKVAIPDPDYPAYPVLAQMMQGDIVRLPFGKDFSHIDWDLWERVLATDVKVLIMSHPANPTGFTFSETEWSHFAEILNRYGIILILDEIYSRLYFRTPPKLDYTIIDRVIRISGVSKSHLMSGWRIGWTIAPQEITAGIIKTKQYVSTCAAWLAQMLACFAIQNPSIEDGIRKRLRTSKEIMLNHLGSDMYFSWHIPDATPYLMLRVQDDLQECSRLVGKGVITVPGRAFGELTRGWIRINYALEDQDLQEGIKRMRQ